MELDNDLVCEDLQFSEDVKTYHSFNSMGLSPPLLKGLYRYGFEKPSLIQQKAIKPIMDGRDVIAQAQSGSGKTATFSVAALQCVEPSLKSTQVLIVAPNRELAMQIHSVVSSLADYLCVQVTPCVGGKTGSVSIKNDQLLKSHLIVGTPGRIIEMIKYGCINVSTIKMLVVDEADEMLNKGLKEHLIKLMKRLPTSIVEKDMPDNLSGIGKSAKVRLQVVIVSATLPKASLEQVSEFCCNPVKILVPKDELSLSGIYQCYIDVEAEEWKFEVVKDIFASVCVPQTVVFVSTRKKVDWLSHRLRKEGFTVSSAHGDMDQTERDHVMDQFRNGASRLLICTNIWARGIDVYTVSLVINYDLPESIPSYLHRIGRSGRFGRRGLAITFVADEEEKALLKRIALHYQISIPPAPKKLDQLAEKLKSHSNVNEKTGQLKRLVNESHQYPPSDSKRIKLTKNQKKRLKKRLAKMNEGSN